MTPHLVLVPTVREGFVVTLCGRCVPDHAATTDTLGLGCLVCRLRFAEILAKVPDADLSVFEARSLPDEVAR